MSLSVLWEDISALTEGGPVSQDKETGEEMEHAATCCGWNQALAHSISGACALPKSCIRIIIGKIDTVRGSGSN